MTPTPIYDDGTVQVYCADCRDVLPTLPDRSVDAVITDPPYAPRAMKNARSSESIKQRRDGKTCAAIAKALRRAPGGVRQKLATAAPKGNGHAAAPAVLPASAVPQMPPLVLRDYWRGSVRRLSSDDLGRLALEAVAERDRRIAKLTRQLNNYKEAR